MKPQPLLCFTNTVCLYLYTDTLMNAQAHTHTFTYKGDEFWGTIANRGPRDLSLLLVNRCFSGSYMKMVAVGDQAKTYKDPAKVLMDVAFI